MRSQPEPASRDTPSRYPASEQRVALEIDLHHDHSADRGGGITIRLPTQRGKHPYGPRCMWEVFPINGQSSAYILGVIITSKSDGATVEDFTGQAQFDRVGRAEVPPPCLALRLARHNPTLSPRERIERRVRIADRYIGRDTPRAQSVAPAYRPSGLRSTNTRTGLIHMVGHPEAAPGRSAVMAGPGSSDAHGGPPGSPVR